LRGVQRSVWLNRPGGGPLALINPRARIPCNHLMQIRCSDARVAPRCSNVYGKVRSFVRDFLSEEKGVALDEDKLLSALHEKKVVEELLGSLGSENERLLLRPRAGAGSKAPGPTRGGLFLHVRVGKGSSFLDPLMDAGQAARGLAPPIASFLEGRVRSRAEAQAASFRSSLRRLNVACDAQARWWPTFSCRGSATPRAHVSPHRSRTSMTGCFSSAPPATLSASLHPPPAAFQRARC